MGILNHFEKQYKNLCVKEFYNYIIGDFIREIIIKYRGYIL